MPRKVLALAMVVLLTAGCLGGARDATVKALQTQVAELSAQKATPTAEPAPTKEIVLPTAISISPPSPGYVDGTIPTSTDDAAFCEALAIELEYAGWTVDTLRDDALDVTSPDDKRYRIMYDYQNEDVVRLVLFSLWWGVGESNLSCDVLTDINSINDNYNWAKASVDSDGDVWIESVYYTGRTLDVDAYIGYLEWFGQAEDSMVYDLLGDYLE